MLLLWLLASGCFWYGVQVFAWARMLAVNLDGRPVTEAVSLTFSEEGMCGLCETVQSVRNRSDEEEPVVLSVPDRPLLLLLGSGSLLTVWPPHEKSGHLWCGDWDNGPKRSLRPPVPPPREAV